MYVANLSSWFKSSFLRSLFSFKDSSTDSFSSTMFSSIDERKIRSYFKAVCYSFDVPSDVLFEVRLVSATEKAFFRNGEFWTY